MEDHSIKKIKSEWGENKTIPPHLEKIFYETICYYPELKKTYYFVVEDKFFGIQHTLRAYPPLLSLFSKRKNRVYPIVINTNKKTPLSFYQLGEDEQKGILAHEMAHTLQYLELSSWELIKFSLKFTFSKNFVSQVESSVDKLAILKGCGDYLLAERENFVKRRDAHFENYMTSIYLYPEEIKNEMKKYPNLYLIPDLKKEISTKKIVPSKNIFLFHFFHTWNTIIGFLVALFEMMNYVYIKKIHKKPDWYLKKSH